MSVGSECMEVPYVYVRGLFYDLLCDASIENIFHLRIMTV